MASEQSLAGITQRQIALVTGASSGIGRDLAILLAQGGFDLVLLARNREALQAVSQACAALGAKASVLAADLSQPAEPQRVFDELQTACVQVDVLVNNAGFGMLGRFAESDLSTQLAMVQVNISALLALTRLFVPGMIERGRGRILNVASTAALTPGPYMSTYYASKAFVLSHSVALAEELRHTGVTVTALCPGPTHTDFQRRAGMEQARLFRLGKLSSMKVAHAGYKGMLKGKLAVFPGLINKLSALAARFGPRGLVAKATGKLNRRP